VEVGGAVRDAHSSDGRRAALSSAIFIDFRNTSFSARQRADNILAALRARRGARAHPRYPAQCASRTAVVLVTSPRLSQVRLLGFGY
jgi:hypothetical protein